LKGWSIMNAIIQVFGRLKSRAVVGVSTVMIAGGATSAAAANLCPDMVQLIDHAQTNFASHTTENAPQALANAQKCQMSQSLSGAQTYHCTWQFTFRDVAATALFDAYNTQLPTCFSNMSAAIKDQSVNHPDFYDQRQYRVGPIGVSVSLKDKTALGLTYVFVAVTGAISD
jgi:hypothetical protein